MKAPINNHQEFREGWLRAATAELGPYFASVGYPLPDDIRFAIAFTSTGRKGKVSANVGTHQLRMTRDMRFSSAPILQTQSMCWVC